MSIDTLSALNPGASAQAAAGKAGKDSARELSDSFLTLLVAQMKNQDPLNPTDNAQITSQLAQINTVGGIKDLNDTLSRITGQINTTQRLQASTLIGKQVLVPGNQIKVGADGTATVFGVDLAQAAAKMTLTITDNAGNVVHRSDYQGQGAGVHSFNWDGLNAGGVPVGAGRYRLSVEAVDDKGEPIAARPLATGYVSGVVTTSDEPRFDLGPDGLVGMQDIYQII